MVNYICINGKKAELTEEQMKALGIELPKANPFDRTGLQKRYYSIIADGKVYQSHELGDSNDRNRHEVANYCTDRAIMEQRALYETLNRLLWRYSMEHDGDKINWHDPHCRRQYYIVFDYQTKDFDVNYEYTTNNFMTHFYTEEIALNAIEEIIKPFMEAHPEFKM